MNTQNNNWKDTCWYWMPRTLARTIANALRNPSTPYARDMGLADCMDGLIAVSVKEHRPVRMLLDVSSQIVEGLHDEGYGDLADSMASLGFGETAHVA